MAGDSNIASFTVFLFILIAVGLVFLLYLAVKNFHPWRSSKRDRIPRFSKKTVRTLRPIATQAPSSQALAQRMILDDTGMIIPEMSVSEPSSEDYRRRIERGMELIFPSKPIDGAEGRGIGKLENLPPHIRKAILHHIDHLKNFRITYQLYKTLDDPNVSLSELSKMIVTDPILTGKILKIANSAYFGMQQKVSSIGHALMIIGLLNLKTILYQDGLLKLLRSKSSPESLMIDSLWEHSTLTSICASHIQSLFGGLDKGTLFTLGLLHDIGKFVIHDLPAIHEDTMPLSVSVTEFTIYDEEKVYGVNHAVVGRLLFDLWGFPEQMGRMIERHHDPSTERCDMRNLDSKDFEYLLALFLSNQIAKVFAGEDKSVSAIAHLSTDYNELAQKKRFYGVMMDSSLFSEIKKAKALAKTI